MAGGRSEKEANLTFCEAFGCRLPHQKPTREASTGFERFAAGGRRRSSLLRPAGNAGDEIQRSCGEKLDLARSRGLSVDAKRGSVSRSRSRAIAIWCSGQAYRTVVAAMRREHLVEVGEEAARAIAASIKRPSGQAICDASLFYEHDGRKILLQQCRL